jgi:hypothetical protein
MAKGEQDSSNLIVAAGLDPQEVEVTVVRRRLLRGSRVRASHSSKGLSCEAEFSGNTADNAAAAIAGLVDLLTGAAS